MVFSTTDFLKLFLSFQSGFYCNRNLFFFLFRNFLFNTHVFINTIANTTNRAGYKIAGNAELNWKESHRLQYNF